MSRPVEVRELSGQLPTPVYADEWVTLYEADCRDILPLLDHVDVVVTDPPYGDTSLDWDVPVEGWMPELERLSRQLWCYGSFRFFMRHRDDFAGWTYGQDIIWEKHNGSGSARDRWKRVHEHAVQWYRGEWGTLYNEVPVTHDAVARAVRRKHRPPHWGDIGQAAYQSHDGGPRLQRSVVYARSEHGRAIHRTQKPVGVTSLFIENSCPPGGVVLDPFAGSCTTLVAAKMTGRRAIGIEIKVSPRAIDRIAQGVLHAA